MNTARLARAGVAGAELHVGVRFDDHPRLRALAAAPHGDVALLYPAGDAPTTVHEPPRTLVVVDGTWTTARKIVGRSRLLRALPRVSLRPAAPSAYRIRREPAAHCLSTVEAIVAALTMLEGDGARFAPLLAAFDRLVTTQLDCASRHRLPYRHDRKRARARRPSAIDVAIAVAPERVVVVQAEGNPHDAGGPHELVHLVATRPATGARFAAIVRPARPVGARTPARLGLEPAALADGMAPAALANAWSAFARPDDVLVGWGRFTPTLLEATGIACPTWIDLRADVARRLGRGVGGADAACTALAAPPRAPWTAGRAGDRVATLARLVAAFGGSQVEPDAIPDGT